MTDPPTTPPPAELTYRDVRDALWLARRIVGDDAVSTTEQNTADPLPPPEEDLPEPSPPEEPTGSRDRQDLGPQSRRLLPPGLLGTPGQTTTAPVVSSAAPKLRRAGELARALRPFARAVPSRWKTELDEEATAVRAAESGQWIPVWRPAEARRFDVALVVDTAASMELWRPAVGEFRRMLERLGAFRDVRVFHVDCSAQTAGELVITAEGSDQARGWRELLDPAGERLVLVASDTIGAGWRSGAVARLLARWGARTPTAVLHTMPRRLWHWGGIAPRPVRLSTPAAGSPHQRLRAHFRVEPAEFHTPGAVPIPVLEQSAEWLEGWSQLVARPGSGWIETTAVLADPLTPEEEVTDEAPEVDDETAEDQLLRFRTFASPQAFELAGLLAAVPLSTPIMRQVQRVMLPDSDLSVLAEVVLGGLLERIRPSTSARDPATPTHDFKDGLRAELLSTGHRADSVRVARVIADWGDHNPALRNFKEAVDHPESANYPDFNDENAPYLEVQRTLLRALSGAHLGRANHIGREMLRRIADEPSVAVKSAEIPISPWRPDRESEPMEDEQAKEDQLTPTQSLPGRAEAAPSLPEGGDVTAPGYAQPAEGGPPADQPTVWGGEIPLRNPGFVGRSELLEQLHSQLAEPGTTAVLPEALHGLGGVGKTQTVVEYIYRHAADYDLIWWVSAERLTQIRAGFVELARQIGLPAASTAEAAVASVVDALRRRTPFARWLLVFDNADRPDDLRPFIPAVGGHVIVTSRNPDWSGIARTVEVDLFTRRESEELLRRRDDTIGQDEADLLADALGDLPLAIEQASAWRSQTGMPVREYIELLNAGRSELLESTNRSDTDLPVAAVWNVTLSRLRTEHPAALQLLQICAFFGPEPISRDYFSHARGIPVPDELREAIMDPIKLNRAIREFSRYSLAKIDHRRNTLQLHRLVQTVLRNQVAAEEHEDMRHIVHLLLASGAPSDPTESENWPRYENMLPHFALSGAARCDDEWVRRVSVHLIQFLLNIGDYEGARDLSGEAWQELTAKLGETHLDTLQMARQHGIALRRFGQLRKGRDLNQRTYRLLQDQVEPDSEHLMTMADVLATDQRVHGEFAQELETRKDVHDRARRLLGEDDPETLRYAYNYCGALRLAGQFSRARELDEQTWRKRVELLGSDNVGTLSSLNALAIDQRECGQYWDAERTQADALAKERRLFGDDHATTRAAARSLAVAKLRTGDYEAAHELAVECHERAVRRLGPVHEDSATTLMNVSASHRKLRELEKALELGEQSAETLARANGSEHPFTLVTLTNLAVINRLLGKPDQALKLNQRLVSAFRSAFTADHPFALVAATNMASDLAAGGDAEAAHELDEDTAARFERVLGAEHPATLAATFNRSLDLALLGRHDESAILQSKAVQALRGALGSEHPDVLAAAAGVRLDTETDTMQL
ncbi:FxSxx-COOH system tetratricopeptide repeat protein [Saccharopolyspora dendranthemae]|uniref:Tetratricopeptide repeat protein n=1 Tax=Saccharopolyspora dendranthemae TaxID=1181886 RepID=A0A561U9N1_9PSEU|nr:FxSxx-COOH system tetratricopeptide repeat protein [Saccharopolyspora dendranthemae]TWF96065.1 tetratricopeptide repeat protein [Saccharopolyspora dendranthemae]